MASGHAAGAKRGQCHRDRRAGEDREFIDPLSTFRMAQLFGMTIHEIFDDGQR
jgi:hypothetical protein